MLSTATARTPSTSGKRGFPGGGASAGETPGSPVASSHRGHVKPEGRGWRRPSSRPRARDRRSRRHPRRRAACRTPGRRLRAVRRRTHRPPPAGRSAPAGSPGARARARPTRRRASNSGSRAWSPRRSRWASSRASAAAGQLALRDEGRQALGLLERRAEDVERGHVAGALPDRVERRVAQEPRQAGLLHVAVAAEALERLERVLGRALADPVLHDGGREAPEGASCSS